MAISTLAQLKTQVKSFVHRANLNDTDGTANEENLILLGEFWIWRNVKAPEMEATLSGSIGADGTIPVPSDYVAWKHARITTTPSRMLKLRPAHFIYHNFPLRSATGKPEYIARDGGAFVLGPFPDSTYSYAGFYYAKLTSILSAANALFLANPDLYLYAALSVTEAYVKNNPQVTLWIAQRDAIARDINNLNNAARHGTGMGIAPDTCPVPVW